MGSPNSNSNRVDSLVYNDRSLLGTPSPHGNCIAWFDTASNDFNISSCGWETVTTKSRLNAILEEFAPERRIFQKNWQWFVSDFLGMAEPFTDGMKV